MKTHVYQVSFIFLLLVSILLGATLFDESLAQMKFPEKPITVLVPWGAGGGGDLQARSVQQYAEKILNQPLIVINKTGGGGTIAFNECVRSPADGYTILIVTPSIVVTPHTVKGAVNYIENLDPIIKTTNVPTLISSRADAPWKNFKEFIDYGKANPKKIRVGNSGYAAMYHMAAMAIEEAIGVEFTHVPFKGNAPALVAAAGGHIDAIVSTMTSALQLVKSGKLKALAIASPNRSRDLPEIPTLKELGFDVDVSSWYGFLTAKGTAEERIKIIHDAFKKVLEMPDFQRRITELGAEIDYLGSSDFAKFLKDQDKLWFRIIKAGGFGIAK